MVLCLHYGVLVLQLTDDTVILAVAKAKRDDTGKYTVTLKNPSGVETSTVNVNVLGELTDFFSFFLWTSLGVLFFLAHIRNTTGPTVLTQSTHKGNTHAHNTPAESYHRRSTYLSTRTVYW